MIHWIISPTGGTRKPTTERVVTDIRRQTRKHHSSEEKIRGVLEGLRGEEGTAALCRREGIATSLEYSRPKETLEAGKTRRAGDTAGQATSPEVKDLRAEAARPDGGCCRSHPRKPPAQKSMPGELPLGAPLVRAPMATATTYEIPRVRDARDHPPGRTVPSAGAADAGQARHSQDRVPSVV